MAKTVYPSSLLEKDRLYVWHPFTRGCERAPLPIVRAKGAYVYTEDGRAILDGASSWWVNLHGHAHPYIAEKIRLQAETLEHVLFAGCTHPPAVFLAERLSHILPGEISRVFYTDNGATAVEAALKMALQYFYNKDCTTKRTKIICFSRGYHGDTFGAMSVSSKSEFSRPFWSHLFEVEYIDVPLPGKEEESLVQLKAILQKKTAACFIFEPLILGVGGMTIYPKEGLEPLMRACHEEGVITIADEVMTGFGRLGTLFACDSLSEKPDMICLSKGVTGGFLPLGVTACKEYIYEAFVSMDPTKSFLHGHTYTANPLACTAALANLDLLLTDECEKKREMITESHKAFCKKLAGHPKIYRCESIGTILVLEYVSDERNAYFHSLRDELYHFFLERNILLRPLGGVLYVMPPYCVSHEELQYVYDAIISFLKRGS